MTECILFSYLIVDETSEKSSFQGFHANSGCTDCGKKYEKKLKQIDEIFAQND